MREQFLIRPNYCSKQFQLQKMSRNSAAIKNKLLDAFNPILQIHQTTPFRTKTPNDPPSNPKPRTSSQMSITRQSYINNQEKLQEDTVNPFTTSQVTSRSLNKSQSKGKRKYIQVISNPHQIFNQSSRTSLMKSSCILDNRTTAMINNSNTALSSKKHHQSCKNLQILTVGDSKVIQKERNSSVSNLMQSSQRKAVHFNPSFIDNKQALQGSKINSLQQLIKEDQIAFKHQITKNQYLYHPNQSTQLQPYRESSPHRITRAFSLNIQQNPIQRPQTYPLQQNYNHHQNTLNNRMSSPTKAIQQIPLNNLALKCIPLNNGQPAFRTIVKKDINPNLTLQQPNKVPLRIWPNLPHQSKLQQKYSKYLGKQNQFVIFDTMNMRNQIVNKILQ